MSAAEFYNSQGENQIQPQTQTQTKNEVVSALPAPWIREWDNTYNTWYYVNPTTTPPTIQWNHPGAAPGEAHPEQVAAQQHVAGQGQQEGGAPGERGFGTMVAGAAVGGLTNKMFGGPMGTGGAMLTGTIAAQGASMLGSFISNHKQKKDKYNHNMGPPPFQGNQGQGNYGGGRW